MMSKTVEIRLYDMTLIVIFMVVVSFGFAASCIHNSKLASENDRLRVASQQTEILLKDCPVCGSKVEVMAQSNSWYIKCTECELTTTTYGDLDNLIKYWNTGTR